MANQKKNQNSEVFIFPLSSEGLETVSSVFQLMSVLQSKFKKTFKNRPDVKCEFEFSFPRFYSYVQGLEYIKLIAHCKYCSHQLVYFKNLSFQQCYRLIAFRKYHAHTKDPSKMKEMYIKTAKEAPRVYRYQPYYLRLLKVRSQQESQEMTIEQYLKSLPIDMKMTTRLMLATQKYGITESQFNVLIRKINNEYEVPLYKLFEEFQQQGVMYSYAPKAILQAEKRFMAGQKAQHYAHRMQQEMPFQNNPFYSQKSIHYVDTNNPHLPNILVMVTPKMKQRYLQFGQYMGFDLTFSVIRQRPTHHKEYMLGIFGGTTQSKRIIIYGLVVTNSQSVEAYKFIISQFLRLTGKCPIALVTDEQKSLYYAIKQLKEQGIFTGNHLFDMFHVLKKFRKSADGNCFQQYRKLVHAKNRYQYRTHFRQLLNQISNDNQLNILRIFDENSEMYCYSQIPGEFIGANISNSLNQKFHDMLKANIPQQTKYIKAVKVTLILCNKINQPKQPDLQMNPIEQTLNMPVVKPYRTLLCRFIFKMFVREVARSAMHIILSDQEQMDGNYTQYKFQNGQLTITRDINLKKNQYIVMAKEGPYRVYRKFGKQQDFINQNSEKKNRGKWHCLCEFEQKTGMVCSHITKVLMFLGQDFSNHIHKRWWVKQSNLTKRLINYKYVSKFLTLRSRFKVKVKGWKGGQKYQPQDNFNRSSPNTENSQMEEIARSLQFTNDDEEGVEQSKVQEEECKIGSVVEEDSEYQQSLQLFDLQTHKNKCGKVSSSSAF